MSGGDPAAMEGWKQATARLKGARQGRMRDEECRRLVDVLVRAANPEAGGVRGLKKASRALSALLVDLDHDTCARVLDEAMGRVYVKPKNCRALVALFAGIGKGGHEHKRSRVTLEAIRVSLLCAYAHADELGDSVEVVLESCYDALAHVARDSRLEGVSDRMEGRGARDAVCAGKSGMADMARLWRFVHDMYDVPSKAEIGCVLGRHASLGAMLPRTLLQKANSRISQLVQNVARDHAIHEDYERIYDAARESNIRIRYWLDVIYKQHGVQSKLYWTDKESELELQKSDPPWADLVAVKYLILELKGFMEWEGQAYQKIVRRLDVKNPDDIYKIMERREGIEEAIRLLRNKFGAHIQWPFSKARARIDKVGLAAIVRHAKKVLLFQDAAYHDIPHKYYRPNLRGWGPEAFGSLAGEHRRLVEIRERYEPISITLGAMKPGERRAMYESYLCVCSTYDEYLRRSSATGGMAVEATMTPTEICNAKYLFLEMCNIIEKLEKGGLGIPDEPKFTSRKDDYCRLRHEYSAHMRGKKLTNFWQVLESEKRLLSHMPHDIEELRRVMSKLKFRRAPMRKIRRMTELEVSVMEKDIDRERESSNADFYNRFRGVVRGQERRAAKGGNEGAPGSSGGAGGAQREPGTAGTAGMEARSPLCEAEDAAGAAGPEGWPEGWKDDLACGDYGGALARMRVCLALSGTGGGMPRCHAGGGGMPDMEAGTGAGRCWVAVCALDNVPRLLGAGVAPHGGKRHVPGAGRAIARDVLGAARERLAGMGGRQGQVAMVVVDPDGAIDDHGGLEKALSGIGDEMPWVGALAIVRGKRCEVRGVPHSENPLRDGVRDMLLGLGATTGGG